MHIIVVSWVNWIERSSEIVHMSEVIAYSYTYSVSPSKTRSLRHNSDDLDNFFFTTCEFFSFSFQQLLSCWTCDNRPTNQLVTQIFFSFSFSSQSFFYYTFSRAHYNNKYIFRRTAFISLLSRALLPTAVQRTVNATLPL